MKTNFKALAMMVATTLTASVGATSAVAGTYVTQEGTTAQPALGISPMQVWHKRLQPQVCHKRIYLARA